MKTNKFIWCGLAVCEQRDLTGTNVTKRFFGEGEQMSGTNYYFTRDHLGSIREMVDSSGTIQYRASYDPYGRATMIQGSVVPDFGYAGMYYHPASGLNLTLFRAYSADLGRWLSRDPLAESAGLNLYDYVGDNVVNAIDPLGLFALHLFITSLVGAVANAAALAVEVDSVVGVVGVGYSLVGLVTNLGNLADSITADPNAEGHPTSPIALTVSLIAPDNETANQAAEVADLGVNFWGAAADKSIPLISKEFQERSEAADIANEDFSDWNKAKKAIQNALQVQNGGCPTANNRNAQNDAWNLAALFDAVHPGHNVVPGH